MPGGGSILGMINSLSNNRKLLRKKNLFEKGRQLDDPDMTSFESQHRPAEYRHLPESELIAFRKKLHEQYKRKHRKTIAISILVFSAAFFCVYLGSIRISEAMVSGKQTSAKELMEMKRTEFGSRIQHGDFLVSQAMHGEAIVHYRNAVDIFPDSYKANTRLAIAYMKSCLEDYTYCEEGKKHLDEIIGQFPNDVKLLEIRASLLLAAGETEKANADYEKINEIIAE